MYKWSGCVINGLMFVFECDNDVMQKCYFKNIMLF